jgi:dihydrolipoamide dehydrogenase
MNAFDLIIIGAGPGGYEPAIHAGRHGLKTLLIEKEKLGGTCLNRGCIPTKHWLSSAHNGVDFIKTTAATQRLIMRMQKGIEKQLLEAKVTIIYGEATRQGTTVNVNGIAYSAKNIIIATGSTPGSIPGLIPDGQKIFTSDDIFTLQQLPASIAIVGAGVIGLEFADIFSSLGVKVTLYDIVDQVLANEDRDAINLIIRNLERKGCLFKLGQKATGYDGAIILVAAGRKTPKIPVNEYCETTEENVYAVGDINGLALYAHAATYQGLKVVDNILHPKKKIDLTNVPRVLYTAPQLAAVGRVSEQSLQVPFSFLGRAQADGHTDGFIKMYLDANRSIVGCVICAENADALIGEAVVLVNLRISIEQLSDMIHPHPSFSEIFYEISKLA